MGSSDALGFVASQIETDSRVHNPLELLDPFMKGPQTLPLKEVERLWHVTVTQSARTTVRAAVGDGQSAEWQPGWAQFEASLREQIACTIGKPEAPQVLEAVLVSTRASEAMPLFLENMRVLETSLLRLRTVLAFHWSDEDNAYRREENRLSGTVSRPTLDLDRRRSLAQQILAANTRYAEIYLPTLEALRSEVNERWNRCEALSAFFPASEWPEVEQWVALARKAVRSRLAGAEMAEIGLEMDVILPQEVASGDIRIETVDGKTTEVLSKEATARMKEHAQRMQEFIAAVQEEDDAPRRALAAKLLGEPLATDATTERPETTPPPTIQQQRYNPIQRSAWFRLGQIVWWSGLALWVLGVSAITNDAQSWIVGCAIGAALFLALKSAVFFIVLGRPTLHERPGSGFIDLDEFRHRQEMLAKGSLDDAMSGELEEIRRSHGRRVPAGIMKSWADRRLSEARDKKQQVIADADRRGTTINVNSLRRSLLAQGNRSDDYLAHCDQLLLRLEVEYGPEIPVSVVSELADAAESV